jgi:hypothetical protein
VIALGEGLFVDSDQRLLLTHHRGSAFERPNGVERCVIHGHAA